MQHLHADDPNMNAMDYSSNSQATVYFSAPNNYYSSQAISENNYSSQAITENNYSSQAVTENNIKPDECNIEEAESSLQRSDSLNCEDARAVLGRYEYQTGNIEAALRVFDGINIAAVTPKLKISLSVIGKPQAHSNRFSDPPFSINTVALLLEAAYLKSKSLQNFGRYKEAAESCKVVLDIMESSLPNGLPESLDPDHKLQETLTNAVELLPHLWQLAHLHHEAILSYRKILLHNWNFNNQTVVKIQKEFVIFLLYSGGEEAYPPNLVIQIDDSFIPKNNIEEAILLLMILLRKVYLKKIEWDPSILDHLSYALSIAGSLGSLGKLLEELLQGIIDDNEKYLLLALCYYGQGDDISALNLLKNVYENVNPNSTGLALLVASKIHGENSNCTEGVNTVKRAIQVLKDKRDEMVSVGYYLLGVSLSAYSRLAVTDFERVNRQHEALQCLETAGRLTRMVDSRILYDLSLEYAEQRKLDAAFAYANRLVNMEGGSQIKGWMLLARILSAQKRFADGESIINAALDQSEKWDQGVLLRTKAKLQVAQGEVKHAIQTYTRILVVLQVTNKSIGLPKQHLEVGDRRLELEIWNDLATVYISLSQWHDAEACLEKAKAISNYSAATRHTIGLLYEAKGLHKQALKAYKHALDVDPTHVQSLVSIAVVFRKLGVQSGPVARSFLNEALRVDRMNSSAWYNLGVLLKDEGPMCLREAVDCFEAAGVLKETEPIEPFR